MHAAVAVAAAVLAEAKLGQDVASSLAAALAVVSSLEKLLRMEPQSPRPSPRYAHELSTG